MSAQPSDAAPTRIKLPRTIRAVRGALTAEQREQFNAELDDVDAGGLRATLEKWWTIAVINLVPGAWNRLDQAAAGTLLAVPIEQVVPDFAERYLERHGVPYVGAR